MAMDQPADHDTRRHKITVLAVFGVGVFFLFGFILDEWARSSVANLLSSVFFLLAGASLALVFGDLYTSRQQAELTEGQRDAAAELDSLRQQVAEQTTVLDEIRSEIAAAREDQRAMNEFMRAWKDGPFPPLMAANRVPLILILVMRAPFFVVRQLGRLLVRLLQQASTASRKALLLGGFALAALGLVVQISDRLLW